MSDPRTAQGTAAAAVIDSAVLARLIAEVSTPGFPMQAAGYNRTHNRHNR